MTDNVIKLIDWRVKLEMAARRRAGISEAKIDNRGADTADVVTGAYEHTGG